MSTVDYRNWEISLSRILDFTILETTKSWKLRQVTTRGLASRGNCRLLPDSITFPSSGGRRPSPIHTSFSIRPCSWSTNLIRWNGPQSPENLFDVGFAGRRICHFWRVVSARHDVILGRVAKAGQLRSGRSVVGSLSDDAFVSEKNVTSATRSVWWKVHYISWVTVTRETRQ